MDCKICLEEVEKHEMGTLECKHSLCNECIINIVKSSTDDYSIQSIRCPELKCRKEMSKNFIVDKLKQGQRLDLLAKFLKAWEDREVLTNPNLLACAKVDCDNVMRVRNKNQKKFFKCDKCTTEFCGSCRLENHITGVCLVNSEDNFRNLKSEHKLLNCPSCKIPVEKSSGCNHMTCSVCKYSFCWLCRRKYSKMHFSQINFIFGCPGMQNIDHRMALRTRIKYILLSLWVISVFAGMGFGGYHFWPYVLVFLQMLLAVQISLLLHISFKRYFTITNTVLMTIGFYFHIGLVFKLCCFILLFIIVCVIGYFVIKWIKRKFRRLRA